MKEAVKRYLIDNGRKLDIALFNFYENNELVEDVANSLKEFQNEDGGFGNSLEPDLRLPNSSVLATTVALQYMGKINLSKDHPLIRTSMNCLYNEFIKDENRWINIPEIANEYPRAPWWQYDACKSSPEWGNPSAEVLGYLIKYGQSNMSQSKIDIIFEKACVRLNEIEQPEFHEVLCFTRLFDMIDGARQTTIKNTLNNLIKKCVEQDLDKPEEYRASPLTFIDSPDSPFIDLFDIETIDRALLQLKNEMLNDSHWEPNWTWGESFLQDWIQTKKDWSAKLTVENFQSLKAFAFL